MINLYDEYYKDVLCNIINKWKFRNGEPIGYSREDFDRLIKSECDYLVELKKLLVHYEFVKADCFGDFYPTKSFLSFREKTEDDESSDNSQSTFLDESESCWKDFRLLLDYYIRCIRESDRPLCSINARKKGRDFMVPSTLSPSWLQPLGEEKKIHTITFDKESISLFSHIETENYLDTREYVGYPIEAIYDSFGVLERIIPIGIVPITKKKGEYYNKYRFHQYVTFDFEDARVNQDWLNSHIPPEDLEEYDDWIPTNPHVDESLKDRFDLYYFISSIKSFIPAFKDIMPETLVQFIPKTGRKREHKLCNTVIIFKSISTTYVRSLLRELEYIKKAPSELLEMTSLAYIYRNPPLPIKELEDKKAIPFVNSNYEQLKAVSNALNYPVSKLQGPPGTGKTQVAVNMIANCIYQNESVLFTSKNHKAVDAIKEKNNSVLGEIVPLVKFCLDDNEVTSWFDFDESIVAYSLEENIGSIRPDAEVDVLLNMDSFSKLDDLSEKEKAIRKEIHALSGKISRLFLQEKNLFAETRFDKDSSLFDIKKASKISSYLDSFDSSSFIGKIRNIFVKRKIQNRLSEFFSDSPRYENYLKTRNYSALKVELENAIKIQQEKKKLFTEYYEKNTQLKNYPLNSEGIINRNELFDSIRKAAPDALFFKWFSSVTKMKKDDDSNNDLLLLKEEFKKDNKKYLTINPKDLDVYRYQKAFTTLHSYQQAWSSTLLSLHRAAPLIPGVFDQAIVDEAAQCDCISIIPLMYRAKRIAIIGDPEQFSPIINMSKRKAKRLSNEYLKGNKFSGLTYQDNTAYSVIPSKNVPFVMLKEHYRCVSDIIDFCSANFYKGNLVVKTNIEDRKIPQIYEDEGPVHWVDIDGNADSHIVATVDELEKILATGYSGSIGIICPLSSWVEKIEKLARERGIKKDIIIRTAYGFQGGEKDTIIFVLANSCDRKLGQIWYTESPENNSIYNVSISRAQGCLVLVGNRKLLSHSNNSVLRSLASYPREIIDSSADFDSVPERILYNELKAAKCDVVTQYPVSSYRLDIAYIKTPKIDIEVDGRQYHYDRYGNRKKSDIARDKFMQDRGWKVIRFSAKDVLNNPKQCVDDVLHLINEG